MDRSKAVILSPVGLIVLLALVIRLVMVWQPLVEVHTTRQVMTAMVARNFYYHGYNIFYPELDAPGEGPYLYPVEFPLMPFITALLYGLTGGVHEVLGRLVAVAFSLGVMFPVYQLVTKYVNQRVARWSILLFAISPLSILYSRTFQPEPLMLLAFTCGLWLFDCWLDRQDWVSYGLALLATAVAILVRAYALIIAFPMLYLAWCKYGVRAFTRWSLWVFAVVSVLPGGLWYSAMFYLTAALDLPVNLWAESIWDTFGMLTSGVYYRNMWASVSGIALTPLGIPFFIMGVLLKNKKPKAYVFHVWLLGVLVFFVIIAEPNAFHDYYQFSLIPVAAVFIGRALDRLQERQVFKDSFLTYRFVRYGLVLFVAGVLLWYVRPIFRTPAGYSHVLEAGQVVQEITERDDLVIAAQGSGPTFLYYCDRKGWGFMIQRSNLVPAYIEQGASLEGLVLDPIELLESHRAEGAAYFAAADMSEFNGEPEFAAYMHATYPVVRETPHYIIFDLR